MTQWRRERDASRLNLAQSCLSRSGLRTELSNCFWNTSDTQRIPAGRLTSRSLQKHFLTSESEQRLVVSNCDCVCGVRGKQKKIDSFVDQTSLVCVFSFLEDIFYNIFKQVRSALLTLLVYMKRKYIILVENSLRAALMISSKTHIGTMEIWKMPTFSPRKELILLFPLERTLLERLILLNKTKVFFDNTGNRKCVVLLQTG